MKLFEKIKNADYLIPNNPPISSNLKKLLKKMLEKDPKKRITM